MLDKELGGIKQSLEQRKKERLKPDLMQKQRETLDIVIETLQNQLDGNRRQYRYAQELAGDLYYQLASEQLKKSKQIDDDRQRNYHRQKMVEYASQAQKRLQLILQMAPELAVHHRNMAEIAKLQGNYELAATHLQQYLERYPLTDPKERVAARLELQGLQQLKKRQLIKKEITLDNENSVSVTGNGLLILMCHDP